MPSKNNISQSDTLRIGKARYGRAHDGTPGVLVTLNHRFFSMGALALAVANSIATSQAVVVATTPLAVINGALAAGGVATMPNATNIGRNVVAAWTGTAVLTITGTDIYGARMQEVSASGTAHTGKKAFRTITSLSFSADVTGATVGTGVVFGLPSKLPLNGFNFARVTATAGAAMAIDAATVLSADTTNPATGVTGDIRGTVTFASAPDGTKTYGIAYFIDDVQTKVGAYGLKQFGSTDVDPV